MLSRLFGVPIGYLGIALMRTAFLKLEIVLGVLLFALSAARSHAETSQSDLRDVIENYSADRGDLLRQYDVADSPNRAARMEQFYRSWQAKLQEIAFDGLGQSAKIDYLLLANHIDRQRRQLELDQQAAEQIDTLVPFLTEMADLEAARRRVEFVEGKAAANQLGELGKKVAAARSEVDKQLTSSNRPKKTDARRAALALDAAARSLARWYEFYHAYDPTVGWWIEAPYKKLDTSIKDYAKFLRQKVAGISDEESAPVLGSPIGRAGLESELAAEMIPYDPERLLKLAEREMQWCHDQLKAASRDLGYGDDWKKALEHVKEQYEPP